MHSIIGTCQSDLPWICPSATESCFTSTSFWWNTCDTDSPLWRCFSVASVTDDQFKGQKAKRNHWVEKKWKQPPTSDDYVFEDCTFIMRASLLQSRVQYLENASKITYPDGRRSSWQCWIIMFYEYTLLWSLFNTTTQDKIISYFIRWQHGDFKLQLILAEPFKKRSPPAYRQSGQTNVHISDVVWFKNGFRNSFLSSSPSAHSLAFVTVKT